MSLRYAAKIAVGDKVRFTGVPHLAPLTVSSVEHLADGRVCVGYAERDGRGAVYPPREILHLAH